MNAALDTFCHWAPPDYGAAALKAAEAADAALYQRHHLAFHQRIVTALENPLDDTGQRERRTSR